MVNSSQSHIVGYFLDTVVNDSFIAEHHYDGYLPSIEQACVSANVRTASSILAEASDDFFGTLKDRRL